jgi:hypothetical protein
MTIRLIDPTQVMTVQARHGGGYDAESWLKVAV